MSACLALQEPLKIAYMGPEGTFSHAAARGLFGLAATYLETTTLEGVFDAVARHEARHGVVPIENSTEGSVDHVLDALVGGNLLIRAELGIEVAQCLLSRRAACRRSNGSTRTPRRWGNAACGWRRTCQAPSSCSLRRRPRRCADRGSARRAVAGRLASDLYGVPVLRERIQDQANNVTRFVIVSTEDAPRTGHDKTTLAFSLRDGRGALMRVLSVFDEEDVNLTRIESRPSREKPWDYVFLADLEGHREDANVARSQSRLAERCPMVKHLGSYPRARAGASARAEPRGLKRGPPATVPEGAVTQLGARRGSPRVRARCRGGAHVAAAARGLGRAQAAARDPRPPRLRAAAAAGGRAGGPGAHAAIGREHRAGRRAHREGPARGGAPAAAAQSALYARPGIPPVQSLEQAAVRWAPTRSCTCSWRSPRP